MSKRKKTKATPSKKGQNIQHAHPASMFTPFEQMDQWFQGMPARWRRHLLVDWPSRGELPMPFDGRIPNIDVIDRGNKIVVRAEIPGVKKKDLDISVNRNSVKIKGSIQHEKEGNEGDYFHRETTSGAFVRTVLLPDEVNTEKVKTKFKGGVLEITLRKLKKSKRKVVPVA